MGKKLELTPGFESMLEHPLVTGYLDLAGRGECSLEVALQLLVIELVGICEASEIDIDAVPPDAESN